MSAHVLLSVHLASEETAGLENFLASDDNNALPAEQVFGDVACQAAKQVATSINDNFLLEHA
jgi:hypothetical protein